MKRDPVRWDEARSAAESARDVLPAMAEALFLFGRSVADGEPSPQRLHEFRLEAKRFRYTLEIFQPVYDSGADEKLALLRKMQQHLGKISDCASTRALLNGLGKVPKKERVERHVDAAEGDRIAKFLVFWRETFDAPGEQERWVRFLRYGVEPASAVAADSGTTPEPAGSSE